MSILEHLYKEHISEILHLPKLRPFHSQYILVKWFEWLRSSLWLQLVLSEGGQVNCISIDCSNNNHDKSLCICLVTERIKTINEVSQDVIPCQDGKTQEARNKKQSTWFNRHKNSRENIRRPFVMLHFPRTVKVYLGWSQMKTTFQPRLLPWMSSPLCVKSIQKTRQCSN